MDEVINAGDEEFKEKCQERLDRMLKSTKAVVVCTHNLANVEAMATRAMWVEQGAVRAIGTPADVVKEYRQFVRKVSQDPFYSIKARQEQIR
jgi:ABC-type polysaccharide/polyol phosphate transport system ATPase subunit